mgnify:CR=1 FL=1
MNPALRFLIWFIFMAWHFGLFANNPIPSSPRSRQAIERVKPDLEAALDAKGLKWGSAVFIRIFKKENQLEVWLQNEDSFLLFRTYKICTCGPGGLGPKLREGDQMAPEGFYFVIPNKLNPSSNFHLAFNIGYPNAYDRYHGRTGSAIMVHGRCSSIGCFAMRDNPMEEIYALADAAFRNGQPFFRIHVFPFRMTARNMSRYRSNPNYSFWENLMEGYLFFEENGNKPPNVKIRTGRYVFE